MRDYGIVSPKFWIGETGKKLRGNAEAQVLALYLMTSPHSNMIGVFHCPVMYMAHETGLGMEGASKALASLIEAGYCTYDESSETVFVRRMAAFQIAEQLKPDDNRAKWVVKEWQKISSSAIRDAFHAIYCEAYNLPTEGGKHSPLEAPSKPPPSQEQEQEQEQKPNPSGKSAAKPPPSRRSAEACTLATYLAACQAAGKKPVPADHPVRAWAADAGISTEMLQIAWVQFRERYLDGEKGRGKRYRDWPAHFATAVRGNWFRLWYLGDEGMCWTSTGLTHKAVLDARAAKLEVANAPA